MRPSGPLPTIACGSITLSLASAAARGLMRKRAGAAGDGAAGASATRRRRGGARGRRGGLCGGRRARRRGTRRRRRRRNGLALLAEIGDDALHRDADADADDDLEQRACAEALDLHHRLVGLDQEQHVALGDRVALLLQPLDDGAVFGHLTEFGHDDRRDHGAAYRIERAAAIRSSTLGRNACSSTCACGAMPFLAPTRRTGASR